MKNFCVLPILCLLLFDVLPIFSQDSLSIEVLKPLTYTFTIENGQLTGEGAAFLKKELAETQFTLIGDYPNSERVSEFTTALIPNLNQSGYQMMVLGIGPISGQKINDLSNTSQTASKQLKNWNQRYLFKENEKTLTPIPILQKKAAALMIDKAKKYDWSIIGVGRESWNGLAFLLDELYRNLSKEQQQNTLPSFKMAKDTLLKFYAERNSDLALFCKNVKDSKVIQDFLQTAAIQPKNTPILIEFKHSLLMCSMYATKDFYDKNGIRVNKEKQLLRAGLATNGFDIHQGKLLLKMDAEYTAKGFQSSAFYGIGNTLHELAAFNGTKALNIGFFRRFYMEKGVLKDELDLDYYWTDRYSKITQMGQKEEWVIIDLRPMIEGTYYWPTKYLLTPWINDLIRQYDLIIIPKVELEAVPNYD